MLARILFSSFACAMSEEISQNSAAEQAAQEPINPFLNPVHIVEPENKLPDYTFNDLPADLKATLEKHGWSDLMPVQRKTMPYMLAARDMLVQSKTGSGKTGAFVLPLIQVIVREQIPASFDSCSDA